MKYKIERTSSFKREFKFTVKRRFIVGLLKKTVRMVADDEDLPLKY